MLPNISTRTKYKIRTNPEITHRFQTAKAEVRALLLQCLLPWLENVELVAANVTPATPLSYIMVSKCKRFALHTDDNNANKFN